MPLTNCKTEVRRSKSSATNQLRRRRREDEVPRGTTIFIITKGAGHSEKVTALKVPRQCPLVLLVKLDWNQAKALGSEAGGIVDSDLLGSEAGGIVDSDLLGSEAGGIVDSDLLGERWRREKFSMWAEFCVWRAAAF